MSEFQMTADVENIKKMSDFPNRGDMLSAEQVKARFDQAAVDIKKHINEVIAPAIEKNQTVAKTAVLFCEQTLKKDQQEQVRANIGAAKNTAVLYEVQAISDEQKAVARENISAEKTITRNAPENSHIFAIHSGALVERNGKFVYEYGPKQDWLTGVDDFDLTGSLYTVKNGLVEEQYTFKKRDLEISNQSEDENDQLWECRAVNCEEFGVPRDESWHALVCYIGNGIDPITKEKNNKLTFVFNVPDVSLRFYKSINKVIEARPVTSVNGKTPDINGDVSTNEYSVLYTLQSLTASQKKRARENIGAAALSDIVSNAVTYGVQELDSAQKIQARANIGAASQAQVDFLLSNFSSKGLILTDERTSEKYTLFVRRGKLVMEKE